MTYLTYLFRFLDILVVSSMDSIKWSDFQDIFEKSLVTPIIFMPALFQYIEAGPCCRSQGLHIGDIDDYLSPVIASRIPSSTINPSQCD